MSRTHDSLTDSQVRALRPGSIPIDVRDGELRGLILTIHPNGKRQWTIRYRARDARKNRIVQRRAVLGLFPGLSIAKARKKGRKVLSDIDGGRDVVGEQQATQAVQHDTVKDLVADYLKRHARPHKRSAAEDERMLNADVIPAWGSMAVRDISRRDVRELLDRIVDRGAPVGANRTLALVRRMLNHAVDREWIDANPAARIKKPTTEVSRDRVLTDDELQKLWRCLCHLPETAQKPAPGRRRATGKADDPLCPVSAQMAALLKIRLLTAQRGGECARMRWADVDLEAGWWTIPAEFTKNKKVHRVPLTKEATAIIEDQRPTDDDDDEDDEVEPTNYIFVGPAGVAVLARAKKAPAALSTVLGFSFTGHDFRRTAATAMAEAGIPRQDISAVLNHSEGNGPRVTQVYDRYGRDREKRIALEAWNRHLDRVISLTPSTSTIVPHTRRRR